MSCPPSLMAKSLSETRRRECTDLEDLTAISRRAKHRQGGQVTAE